MYTKKVVRYLGVLCVMVGLLAGAEAIFADFGLDPYTDPNFGSVHLEAGFTPDPYTKHITSGGDIDLSEYFNTCAGFATSSPDFRVNWTGSARKLSFFFVGDGDTSMVVNDPYGEWICDDDWGNSEHPYVSLRTPGEGQYDIWIGSYNANDYVDGYLYVTDGTMTPNDVDEDAAQNPPSYPGDLGINANGSPNYGSISLEAGFTNDPYSKQVTSGGDIDLGVMNVRDCVGYVTSRPDFRLNWEGASGSLAFVYIGEEDATMMIHDPMGDWFCADDWSNTMHPVLRLRNPAAGKYEIWVGSYNFDEYGNGVLYISETDLTPRDLE